MRAAVRGHDSPVSVARRLGRWCLVLGGSGLALALSTAPAMAAPVPDETPVEEIARCVRDNFPLKSARQRLTLITHDRTGGRTRLQARVFWQPSRADDNRFHVRLDEPADLAGSAYLLVQDEGQSSLFVYVPGLNRVRRMRGAAMAGELWGTSLNYNDFQYAYGIAVNAQFELQARQSVGGREAYRLAAPIPPATGWGFAEAQVLVDVQVCVVLGVDFLDDAGHVRKQLRADPDSLIQVQGYWTAERVAVDDLDLGRRTELTLEHAAFDEELPLGLFESRSFYRIRLPPLEP